MTIRFALLYLGAIAAAELVTVLVNPIGGVALHIVLLLLLVLHSSLAGQQPGHKLYLALSLAPLIRILSLSMPITDIPRIYWYVIIAVPLMVGAFLVTRRLGFSLRKVGFVRSGIPLQLLTGGSAGFLFGLAGYYVLKMPEPLVSSLDVNQILLLASVLLIAGFAEEVTFRGVMQRSAMDALGRWGWIYVAFLFAILQIGYLSAFHLLFALAIGLLFGWVVWRTGSIVGVILAHGVINITLYLIAPFFF